jgi:hypothetical protein
LPILGKKVKILKEVVDKLTIFKAIQDVRDYTSRKYKACLLPDMTGSTVTKLTFAGFLVTNIEAIYNAEQTEGFEATKHAHKVIATSLKAKSLTRPRKSCTGF